METAFITFCIGYVIGSYFKSSAYDRQDWQCLRWDGAIFGYRPVALGSRIARGEKVVMALKLETNTFPEEGIIYGDDSNESR